MNILERFLQAFIPLFVAIDVFGVLPLYVGLTENMDNVSRRKLNVQSVLTAFTIRSGIEKMITVH